MARIRSIKPEFPRSEAIGNLSRDARLLFIQLWPECDDHGRTRAASRMLASLLFPFDDDAPKLIDGWMDELEHFGHIRRYTVAGATYLEVVDWLGLQKIDKPSKPMHPSFDDSSRDQSDDSRSFASPREPSRAFVDSSKFLCLGSGSGSGSGSGVDLEGSREVGAVAPPADDGKASGTADLFDGPATAPPRPAIFELPAWVDQQAWSGFVEMRKKIRKPLTDRAAKLALADLDQFRLAGHDPNKILDASTKNSWQGLFAPKPQDRKPSQAGAPKTAYPITHPRGSTDGKVYETDLKKLGL